MQEPRVIYQDDAILVIDKPAGMIVYPPSTSSGQATSKHDYPALSSWLEKKYKEIYFVHRIDRETSGVLVVARDEKTFEVLKKQFKNREVRKVYRAFVYGVIKDERGVIDKPIGSARGGRGPRSASLPHGAVRDALTAYRVIARSKGTTRDASVGTSYVEVFPKTGRTHQIRVHFSSIQRPIICDVLYAPTRPPLLGFTRLALHALSIAFTHPSTSSGQAPQEVTFEAPLPEDFVAAEKLLEKA
ncbi:MAG: RluA family pseudouridine synthase [bacterium]|nr:RluA family pseudouridine synthase [bacterium]